MSDLNEEKWFLFNDLFQINNYEEYDILNHIKSIFSDDINRLFAQKYLINDKVDFTDKNLSLVDRNSNKLLIYLLVNSVCLKNLNSLDYLKTDNNNKTVRLYALIQLLNLFNGAYILTKNATSSDFWGIISSGRIDNPTFLSFHVFNYLYHTGKNIGNSDGYSDNFSNVMNMYCSGKFYTDKNIEKTNTYMNLFFIKIKEILFSGALDEALKEFYDKYKDYTSNPNLKYELKYYEDSSLIEHIEAITKQGWSGEGSLYLSRLAKVIE